jgi:hypothetical protein
VHELPLPSEAGWQVATVSIVASSSIVTIAGSCPDALFVSVNPMVTDVVPHCRDAR